jgi:hypothetical protein
VAVHTTALTDTLAARIATQRDRAGGHTAIQKDTVATHNYTETQWQLTQIHISRLQ